MVILHGQYVNQTALKQAILVQSRGQDCVVWKVKGLTLTLETSEVKCLL